MAIEKFEQRRLSGIVNVTCKFEDGTVRYWHTDKETVVEHIKTIVSEYRAEGYVLTLRQLHYQLVTRNWIINHDSAYKKLGDILNDCKYAGVIDWDAIEDRGRVPYLPYWVEDAKEGLEDLIEQFRINRQENQNNVVELWTEKDALSGILTRTTSKYHIHLVVNKGYTSSSAIYGAYRRIISALKENRKFTILYFGDHDPSGLDMVRDIKERLTEMLCKGDRLYGGAFGERVDRWWEAYKFTLYDLVDRGFCDDRVLKLLDYEALTSQQGDKYYAMFNAGKIAFFLEDHELFNIIPIGLTMAQIKEYALPPNPTKLTDTRAASYIKKYGKICWEVDALKPNILTEIVEENILSQIDSDVYEEALKREKTELGKLKKYAAKK